MDKYAAQAANCGQRLAELHKAVKALYAAIATQFTLDICHGGNGHGWDVPFKNKDAITACWMLASTNPHGMSTP